MNYELWIIYMSKKHNIQDTQLVISPVAQAKPAVPFNYVTKNKTKGIQLTRTVQKPETW